MSQIYLYFYQLLITAVDALTVFELNDTLNPFPDKVKSRIKQSAL